MTAYTTSVNPEQHVWTLQDPTDANVLQGRSVSISAHCSLASPATTNFSGSFCQHNDPCISMPCLNGRCIGDPATGNFTCACDHGYTVGYIIGGFRTLLQQSILYRIQGAHCDQDIDECAEWGEAICYNGATCVNIAGGYTCECPAGMYPSICP